MVRLLIAAATLAVLVGAGIVWAGGAHAAGRATPHQYRPVQVPESAGDPTSPSRVKRAMCSKGHVYDAANTYVDSSGRRRCRKCGCKK